MLFTESSSSLDVLHTSVLNSVVLHSSILLKNVSKSRFGTVCIAAYISFDLVLGVSLCNNGDILDLSETEMP